LHLKLVNQFVLEKLSCLPLIIIEVPSSAINFSYMFILFHFISTIFHSSQNSFEKSVFLISFKSFLYTFRWRKGGTFSTTIAYSYFFGGFSVKMWFQLSQHSTVSSMKFSEPVCYWNQWKPSSRRNWDRGWIKETHITQHWKTEWVREWVRVSESERERESVRSEVKSFAKSINLRVNGAVWDEVTTIRL
jgi:hypothetical protein